MCMNIMKVWHIFVQKIKAWFYLCYKFFIMVIVTILILHTLKFMTSIMKNGFTDKL